MFDLPEELLYTLQLKIQPTAAPSSPRLRPSSPGLTSQDGSEKQDGSSAATSCALCGLTFQDLQEQRSHVRSDLHSYNIKQKMRGRKAVTDSEFERLVGQLDESISGSDSTDSEDSDENELNGAKHKDSTLSALLKKQAEVADREAEEVPVKKSKRGAGKPPLIWFSSSKLPSDTSLGVYRAIFSNEEQSQEHHLVETIQRKQLTAKPAPTSQKQEPQEEDGGVALSPSMIPRSTSAAGPHYLLCMIGGGHFAGMLVSLTPKLTKKHGVEDRSRHCHCAQDISPLHNTAETRWRAICKRQREGQCTFCRL